MVEDNKAFKGNFIFCEMKRQIFPIMFVISLIMLAGFVSAGVQGNPGAVWTTTSSCGSPQNVNHYAIGEKVYLHGDNFNAGTYAWDITGQPGQASCDPNIVVSSGNVVVNDSGEFCFEAYTIQAGDCGVYKVSVGDKHDTYQVEEIPLVPEFGLFAGILTVLSAIGIFFFVRKN